MSQKRILVVDDDLRLRDLLTRYLGEQGFAVKSAENGSAMNKALLREAFDAVICDLAIAGGGGEVDDEGGEADGRDQRGR